MLKKLLVPVFLLGMVATSHAAERLDISRMNCASIQAALEKDGPLLLSRMSKAGMPLYGVYVANNNQCGPSDRAAATSVPAKDLLICPVKRCVGISS